MKKSTMILLLQRSIFILLSLFCLSVFISRLYCESVLCVRNLIPFAISPVECTVSKRRCSESCMQCDRTKELCDICEACKDCQSKVDIRKGLDGAGLTILGLGLSFFVLIFIRVNVGLRLKKIVFLGMHWELEELNKEINQLTKKIQIPPEVLDKITELERKIVETSSTPNQQLNLIFLELKKQLDQIYQVLFSKSSLLLDRKSLIQEIKEEVKLDTEEKICDVVNDLFDLREEELYEEKGKHIHKLVDVSPKAIPLLEYLKKTLYKKKRKVYGKLKKIILGDDSIKESDTSKNIIWSAPIGFNDLNENNFSLENLKSDNFKIYETIDGITQEAPIISLQTTKDIKAKLEVILAIDCSISMEGERIKKAKEAAIKLLKQLEKQTNIAPEVAVYKINYDRGWIKGGFYKKTKFNLLAKEIKNLKLEYGTPLWDSLFDIFTNSKQRPGTKLILLISDGMDEVEEDKKEKEYQDIEKLLPIKQTYFGFLGYGNNEDFNLIESLVNKSGLEKLGYFPDQSPQTIIASFNEIFNSFGAVYHLEWESTTKEVGKKVDVEIVIKHPDFKKEEKVPRSYISK